MTEDNLIQLYWALLERWGAQVDSYWTRTNYFAAFEAAAIAGSWAVLDDKGIKIGHWHALEGPLFAVVVAFALTGSWIFVLPQLEMEKAFVR